MVREWLKESRMIAEDDARHAGLTGAAFDSYVAEHRFDLATALAWAEVRNGQESGDMTDTLAALLGEVLPYHKQVADRHGLDLVMYEGGTHAVGIGPMADDEELTEFLIHFNYSEEMGALYSELIAGWYALGGTLFNAYADVYAPSKWGSWGALRHLTDHNPRWDALRGVSGPEQPE